MAMRAAVMVLVGSLLAVPAFAQQLSPLTGTTASPPTANGPATPPAAVPEAGARPRQQGRRRFIERFEAANTTHDGKLTLDQARAGRMPQVVAHFDAIDAQHRGYVTLEDVRAYRRAMREQRRPQQPAR